jgi:hypothetical protein
MHSFLSLCLVVSDENIHRMFCRKVTHELLSRSTTALKEWLAISPSASRTERAKTTFVFSELFDEKLTCLVHP